MSDAPTPLSIRVNGVDHDDVVEPRVLLIDFLRDTIGLTGSHIGCEEGICGACTVEVDGRTVKSCLMFAVQADGADVTTIEGVADGAVMDPVQQAFQAEHGLQCGYCTPGMVMSARALLRDHADPSEDMIRRLMIGNLCRCTGYQPIVAAVRRAAQANGANDLGEGDRWP
jgi:carbon-monoxide dehydrogenase small subunit